MTGWDDADLAARFAAREEAAVSAVYARYAGRIMAVAVHMLRRRELAEEVVQVTIEKAWRAAASYDPTRELAPWLLTIARRVAVDLYRRERRAAGQVPLDDRDIAVFGQTFERTWEIWEVRTALEALPADEREVVRLAQYEGLTQSEIAARLNVPLGTVKSRSARAHGRLAGLLAHLVEVAP